MKQRILGLVLGLLACAQLAAFTPSTAPQTELKPEKYEERAAHVAAEILSRHHYKPVQIDKAMSGQIFDRYLKSLDGDKLFFIQSDIDRIAVNRDRIGEMIFREDLTTPFAIFNLYKRRAVERLSYARSLLQGKFDFTVQESLKLDRAKQAAWPQSEAEVQELWRKRVKNDWLGLKLAGKDDKDILKVLDKRYDNTLKRINKINNTDAFETFMNAYTTTIEPHTNYMGIRAAEEFNISMRLSLIGIGAVLVQTDDYTTIRELVAGGPAGLSGKLKVGDRIVGVAQGVEPMVDIVGWRQDDAVQLIRGALDTTVRLEILPAEAGVDGQHKIVTLVRKPINLKEQAAKSTIQTIKDGATARRIGVITLPSFYEDFAGRSAGTKDFKSASRDVEKLLIDLKKAKVDSVLVDLRGNGGGSLAEAIELTGLFIGNGPVVQQRNAQGKVWTDSAKRSKPLWDGPLGVLINRGSASASEIFAAAIQDYGRGLILGEPSFGKGTVQTIVDLDQVVRNGKPQFGGLKMTVAQFFRINGGTTQLRGVTPDIRFPGYFDDGEFGESSADNALPWSHIGQAEYSPQEGVHAILPQLSARHDVRGNTDKAFKFLQEDIAEYRLQRKKAEISLNETVRRNERDARTALLAVRKTSDGKPGSTATDTSNTDDALEPEDSGLPQDTTDEKAAKKPKDILLLEAAHILSDAVGLAGSPRIAANDAVVNERKLK